jgi:hypothetical protein
MGQGRGHDHRYPFQRRQFFPGSPGFEVPCNFTQYIFAIPCNPGRVVLREPERWRCLRRDVPARVTVELWKDLPGSPGAFHSFWQNQIESVEIGHSSKKGNVHRPERRGPDGEHARVRGTGAAFEKGGSKTYFVFPF